MSSVPSGFEPYTSEYCAQELETAYSKLDTLKKSRRKLLDAHDCGFKIEKAIDLARVTKGIEREHKNIRFWAEQLLRLM